MEPKGWPLAIVGPLEVPNEELEDKLGIAVVESGERESFFHFCFLFCLIRLI